MKIIRLGVVVEVGVPVGSKTKTEKGLNKVVSEFLDNLREFDSSEVVYVDNAYGSPSEINEFNYSINNLADKSETHTVFRFFRNALYVKVPKETDIFNFFGKNFWFTKGDLLLNLTISSIGEHKPKRNQVQYLGTTLENSGELVEKSKVLN